MKWNREVTKSNQKLTTAEKLIITTKKGTLFVDEKPLVSGLICPTRASMLNINLQHSQELKQLLTEKANMGATQTFEDSSFTGYSMATNSVEEINEVYAALRLTHMDAKHIVCAFRIPGPHIAKSQHFHDDGEIGEGRKLMYQLKDADIQNRAVFVVRYCSSHIGGVRHVLYRNAASSAITMNAFNPIRDETQVPWPMEEIKPRKDFTGSQHQYRRQRNHPNGRGHGHNTRGRRSSTQNPRQNISRQTCSLNDKLPGWNPQLNSWSTDPGNAVT